MSTSIEISSNALLLIGDEPINAFDEPGAGAQAAANLYQDAKETLLSWHPWSFALKEQYLSRLSQEPESLTNLKYAFRVPVDSIRIWEIFPYSYYEIVGQLIYSNEPTLLCRYIYDVVSKSFHPLFLPFFLQNELLHNIV